MPRPQKNNADYFPHYNGLRNHRKVKMLRNKFGPVLGYAFWCMMLEWLTEHDGLEWEFSEIEIEMFASELGVSDAEIPPMVNYCIKIELLFKNQDGFIYSESLNDTLNPVFEKRKVEREKSKARQRRDNGTFIKAQVTTSGGVSDAEIPQSKVEYSKVDIPKGIVGLSTPTTTVVSFEKRCDGFIKKFNEIKVSKYQATDKVKRALKSRLKKYDSIKIVSALKMALKDPKHIENNFI